MHICLLNQLDYENTRRFNSPWDYYIQQEAIISGLAIYTTLYIYMCASQHGFIIDQMACLYFIIRS